MNKNRKIAYTTYEGMDNKQSKRKERYNMNKITAIKEVEMSKHILKGLIVSLLAILLLAFTAAPALAFDARRIIIGTAYIPCYNFEFEKVLSDNGPEFKGSMDREHPFEMMCDQLGIKHIYTKPYRPQTNGKVEAFWKIIKNEFFYPNSFDSVKDLIYNLGNFLFEYNHLRRHGGLAYITPYEKLEKVTELLS